MQYVSGFWVIVWVISLEKVFHHCLTKKEEEAVRGQWHWGRMWGIDFKQGSAPQLQGVEQSWMCREQGVHPNCEGDSAIYCLTLGKASESEY